MNKAFDVIRNGFYSVDSFFLIGGCLLTYLTMKELDALGKKSADGGNPTFGEWSTFWLMYYIHRYIRYYNYSMVCAFVVHKKKM